MIDGIMKMVVGLSVSFIMISVVLMILWFWMFGFFMMDWLLLFGYFDEFFLGGTEFGERVDGERNFFEEI